MIRARVGKRCICELMFHRRVHVFYWTVNHANNAHACSPCAGLRLSEVPLAQVNLLSLALYLTLRASEPYMLNALIGTPQYQLKVLSWASSIFPLKPIWKPLQMWSERTNNKLPSHQFLTEVVKGNLQNTLAEDISKMLNCVYLQELDLLQNYLIVEPHCLDCVMLTSWCVLWW